MAELFGTYQGQPVFSYQLSNSQACHVRILNLGGIVQEFSLPLADGKRHNLVVHFDDIAAYYQNPYQVNKQIGRVAGRIKEARFDLKGQSYQLEANDGRHLLHGGSRGLSQVFFAADQPNPQQLVLKCQLRTVQDGFPGDIDLTITYSLDDDNQLTIHYQASAGNRATVFDPTLHIYWALSHHLEGVALQIDSPAILETTSDKIPTGRKISVAGSAYDFRQRKPISLALNELRQEGRLALDDAYEVTADFSRPQAYLWDRQQGYCLEIFSSRNGLIVFTANPFDQAAADQGIFNALATEPQTLPDALHHPEWGDISLAAGEVKEYTMAFKVKQMEEGREDETNF